MREDPPIIDDPEDGVQNEQEFAELMREAQSLNLHYTGHDLAELEMIITLVRQERGAAHPVACYGLSYEPTSRQCRICQLRVPCSELDKRPRVEVLDPNQLEAVLCESCGQGELKVELRVPDSDIVRDYGCTTMGCLNTLGIQCGWSEEKKQMPAGIAFAPKPKEKLEGVIKDKPPRKPRVVIKNEEQAKDAAKKKVEADTGIDRGVDPVKLADAQPGQVAKGRPKLRIVHRAAPEPAPEPKPEPKAKRRKSNGEAGPPQLRFRWNGDVYLNLTRIAALVTTSRNWSGGKFFGCDPAKLKPGDSLQREWQGQVITVEVEVK